MAKRKKKSNKRERIPVIDFLIDMAAAATMDYIAYKRKQKRGGRRSNKVDPYEATGIAMGLGMIDDTEDLIKFGGMLGMMGAFDSDEPDEVYQRSYVGSHDDNPFYAPKNNKYAWRLNCEDGSEYGISPVNYETRDEYHEALHREKYAWREWCEDGTDFGLDPDDFETEDEYEEALEDAKQAAEETEDEDDLSLEAENFSVDGDADVIEDEIGSSVAPSVEDAALDSGGQLDCEDQFLDDDFHVFIYCEVETEFGTDYFRTEDRSIKKGNRVLVPSPAGNIVGTVLTVEHHMRFSAPKEITETNSIIRKA